MAAFLDRTPAVFAPGQEVEYATLLVREEPAYQRRQGALHELGLHAASIEPAER